MGKSNNKGKNMILLTKRAEEILTDEGFDTLSVKRDEDTKHVMLVGKACKQSLLDVSKMPVSAKITQQERAIIIDDYIIPTITKYKKELTELITSYKTRTAEKALEDFVDDFNTKYLGARLTLRASYNNMIPYNGITISNHNLASAKGHYKWNIEVIDNDNNADVNISMMHDFDKDKFKILTKEITKLAAVAEDIAPIVKKLVLAREEEDQQRREATKALEIKCSL